MDAIIRNALARSSRQSDAGVERILDKKLETRGSLSDFSRLWGLADYQLESVGLVQDAAADVQQGILHRLGRGRLCEAWAIEKAGMSFAAKMGLLAQSINEQKLYSLFGAEEACHFHAVDQLLGEQSPLGEPADPFITLLNDIIVSAARRPLILIIQVVLEGWGIEHYASMGKACRDEGVKAILRRILGDEAAHHGSGLALFREADLTPAERDYIYETMSTFLYMVRIGPASVLGAIEQALGGWAPGQRDKVIEQMDARSDTARKLALLEGYLLKAKAEKIHQRLQAANAFAPAF